MIKINSAETGSARASSPESRDVPRIAAFPRGPEHWRIDWFGEVGFPNRMLRRSQPSIFVHLSRVVATDFRERPAALLSPQSTTPAKFQRGCWVSVGTLVLLRIGDIWQDQSLTMQPDYELEIFERVRIDKETTNLIKAGVKPDDGGFLLPIGEHPWHLRATHSYCFMVDLPDDRRLVIPCVELIRFYFGSSSGLLSSIFSPPLRRESLYTNVRADPLGRDLFITLADKVSGASASDIGRLHGDTAAWRAAAHVGASLLKATASGQSAFPQALFPFEGSTTVTCAGKWLSRGDTPQKTFLAYQLRSCSHPFPFNSLRYRASGARRAPQRGDARTSASQASHMHRSAPDARDQQLVEREASNKLTRATRQVLAPVRFPDLVRKFIRKDTVEMPTEEPASIGASGGKEVTEDAVGEPGAGDRVRSVDLSIVMDPNDPLHRAPPEFLAEMLADLSAISSVKITLLTRNDKDGWTIPMPIVADDDGVIEPRLFLNDGSSGLPRLRRLAAFVATVGDESVYIVVVEDAPAWWKLYGSAVSCEARLRLFQIGAIDFAAGQYREAARAAEIITWVFAPER